MALYELIPTLKNLRQGAQHLAERINQVEQNKDLKSELPDFSLRNAGTILQNLTHEIDGQINTAERPFTVAVVGEFKVGKSTFLNAFLGLHGEKALSAKDDHDTACSILIRGRNEGDPEARLVFEDGSHEDTTWERAIGFTSQVWLNANPADAKKAAGLVEVEYFIAHPFLMNLQINDLPGTGSRYLEEHTELTHRKMKQADAVLWIVSDSSEPSADGSRNLHILKECAQQVIPIVNVTEDPEADPPLPRIESDVDNICHVLNQEYADWFCSDFNEPLRISSKVILLESAKNDPDKVVFEQAGYQKLLELAERLRSTATGGSANARLHRICGAGIALGNKIIEIAHEVNSDIDDWLPLCRRLEDQAQDHLDEVDKVHMGTRFSIKTLARDRARSICQITAGKSRTFIEDTLQMSNIPDFIFSGEELKKELENRFIAEYLKLDSEPNWLDDLQVHYTNEVQDICTVAWQSLLSRNRVEISNTLNVTIPTLKMGPLQSAMTQAIRSVLARVLSVAAIAALLAVIPGGQIIDAVGVIYFAIKAMFSDPLEDKRRNAIERANIDIEAQKYGLENQLLDAGMAGNNVMKKEVLNILDLKKESAAQNLLSLRELRQYSSECSENTQTAIEAFDDLIKGSA